MAVGDDCPVEIPCMPRKKANRFNFLRFEKPQNWTYTELKNDGLANLIPCDQVESGGGATIVLDFRSDFNGTFNALLDVIDNSETPKWKTTDDNVNDVDSESPAWSFPNSNEKGIICCLKTPAAGGSYPEVTIDFEITSSGSYIKGLFNISEFDDIKILDLQGNTKLTDIEFGDKNRYLDDIIITDTNLSGNVDFKSTSANRFFINNMINALDNVFFKEAEDEVGVIEFRSTTLNNPLDISGVKLVNAELNWFSFTVSKVIMSSINEIKTIAATPSNISDINFYDATLASNAIIVFTSCPLNVDFGFPTFSGNISRITINQSNLSTVDYSPLNGSDITDRIELVSNNTAGFTNQSFSAFNTIDYLRVESNSFLELITGYKATRIFEVIKNNVLDMEFVFTNIDQNINEVSLNDNAIQQVRIDSSLSNMYSRSLIGTTINVGNDSGGSNQAPSGLDASGDVPATCPGTKSTGADYIRCLVDELGCTVTYWDDVNNQNKTVS